jgi:xylan 1,4-beta-xylosidase
MAKRILAAWLLALPLSLIAAPTPPSRVIDADLAKPRGAMNRMYNFCVGAGRANEGLRADWQRQLRRTRAECGFR